MSKKMNLDDLLMKQRAHARLVRHHNAAERIRKLQGLLEAFEASKQEYFAAMEADYSKPRHEAEVTEIISTTGEIRHLIAHLKDWMKPRKVGRSLFVVSASSEIISEPKGTVLIISPWNYPVYLSLVPIAGAIAAGNTVVLKPSEFTPATSAYLSTLLGRVFAEEEVAVIEGDASVSAELLERKFDHIFFTGSTPVGKIVMAAAARHLASVTLELGGKSPCVIDENTNMAETARRVIWGKFVNCGQTCVAPDYILIPRHKRDSFIEEARKVLNDFYGAEGTRKSSPDYARIVNDRHFKRLSALLDDARKNNTIAVGGATDQDDRFIEPTLITDVSNTDKIMEDEIFGPLLPVLTYTDLNEALEIINQREKPLALYIFSHDESFIDNVLSNTSAGGTCINDTVVHLANPNLPFGGTGASGIGAYHGEYSFRTFSHERAVVRQNKYVSATMVSYPPYTALKGVIKDAIKDFA